MRLLAAVCDTRRIESDKKKMITILQILNEFKLNYVVLGGATNRLTIQIDGYAVKLAVNHQGFKDNFMEYSICQELQPYVTKSYETTGYILIAECVYLMDIETWKSRKADIIRILDELSQDYLLGDVGYIDKNITNWGIRDSGEIVILDYAYCHRATENLFTCERCGEGILVYDITYDHLMCGNRNSCQATYTYNERKRIQGDQVDLDMIEEMKKQSIIMQSGQVSSEVTTMNDQIMNDSVTIVHNWWEYEQAKAKEEQMVSVLFDSNEMMDKLIEIQAMAKSDPAKAVLMQKQLDDEIAKELNDNKPDIRMADDYEEIPDDVWHPGRRRNLTAFEALYSRLSGPDSLGVYASGDDEDETDPWEHTQEDDSDVFDALIKEAEDKFGKNMSDSEEFEMEEEPVNETVSTTDDTVNDDSTLCSDNQDNEVREDVGDSNDHIQDIQKEISTGRSLLVNGKELK